MYQPMSFVSAGKVNPEEQPKVESEIKTEEGRPRKVQKTSTGFNISNRPGICSFPSLSSMIHPTMILSRQQLM